MQALIYCHRFKDAAEQCQALHPGGDRAYLEAEIAWRSGDLLAATAILQEAAKTQPLPAKCRKLLEAVEEMAAIEVGCAVAFEEGGSARCAADCRQSIPM